MKNIALIDNHDSFTYNIKHLIEQTGSGVDVFDSLSLDINLLDNYQKLIIGPGPGLPLDYPNITSLLEKYAQTKSILGICLGHQAIGEVFGAKLKNLSDVFHGVTTKTTQIVDTPLFEGLPKHFQVGRYHSWVVEKEHFPNCLEIIAESKEGLIMALRHRTYNIYGIQFHPESVLTPDGKKIMANWLRI